METYNQHIELIHSYLNNLLSKEEQLNFETKLKTNLEFNSLYEEHIVFVNGLERVKIKEDIFKAQRAYTTQKWIKISGISIIVIGALVMLYTLVFNTSEIEPTSNNDSLNTILVDSVTTKKTERDTTIDHSEVKTDSIKTDSEVEVSYTTTTANKKFGSVSETQVNIQKKPQNIKIDVTNDTIIKCKEGTILKIKKGAFINPNTQQIVTGKINLNVTEYYKLSDILLANLSTVSHGKQLETGGMLYIEAKQNGTALELKDGTPIEIQFPTTNKKPEMQLFSGQWSNDNINWTLQEDVIDDLEILEDIVEVPFGIVEQVPTFPGCEAEDNETRKKCTKNAISKFMSRNFNTDIGIGLGLSGKQRINCIFKIDQDGNVVFIQTRAAHPRLSEEADRVLNLLPQFNPGVQRGKTVIVPYALPILFEIEGEQNNVRQFQTDLVAEPLDVIQPSDSIAVEMDSIYTERRGMVELIREVMHDKDFPVDSLFIQEWENYKKQRLIRQITLEAKPNVMEWAYVLRKPLFEMQGTKFKILEDDSITRGGHIVRVPWDATKVPTTTRLLRLVPKQKFSAGRVAVTADKFDKLLEEPNSDISSRDVSYYVLKTSNLGWINCDRFINGQTKRIKYKLKIKNADGASISMVFKSMNSVLPSWYTNGVYDFQTISAGEDVVLVAIKRKDDKLYYDTVDTTTKANPQLDFDFKEISIGDLKQVLETLNR
ncbi:energy transducer TonB [Psychroserpens luteolus]|uniref:hypothetical protein n=1 Tax=Psychroserpens luteolus TaxID=2855840 RepID=UPI001E5021EE|nr:hypothetical protein [Psychroserpens luteolus]MCD2258092.1 hypothetical protein [Psychroserpens luteolus]